MSLHQYVFADCLMCLQLSRRTDVHCDVGVERTFLYAHESVLQGAETVPVNGFSSVFYLIKPAPETKREYIRK